MRILIITNHFWPENFRINDLAIGLKNRGHDVVVFTGIPDYPAGKYYPGYGILKKRIEHYNGIKVIHFPLIPRGKGRSWNLMLNYLSSTFMACLLAPFCCRGTFDLIFVFETSPVMIGLPAVILKKLKAIPVVFWVLDLWPESLTATGAIRSPFILGMAKKMACFIYGRCDKILVSSRGFVQSIEALGCYPGKIDYFPNWVEPEYLAEKKRDGTIRLPDLPSGFIVMFAGNVGAAQDFETILKAAEILLPYSDIHWVILGEGRRFEWVREQVVSRGLACSVHLLGRYPAETMPGFFALADAMLVTLKRNHIFSLTIPGKIQSYLASGRPIIAVLDGEGGRLVANAGAGLSSPAEDPAALAATVLTMYRTPKDQREEMGRRGKKYCSENFERDMLLDKLEKWMMELTTKTENLL